MPDQPPHHPSAAPRVVRPRLRAPGAGRPRKSKAMHLLEGTRSRAPQREKPLDEHPVRDEDIPPALLSPPAWMHQFAKAFWNANAPALARSGRLKLHHLSSWQILCERFGEWERNAREMLREPLRSKERPRLAAAARQAAQQYLAGCLRFGIDPATDLRLSALDGGDVAAEREAVTAPASATEPDRGEAWLHARRRPG